MRIVFVSHYALPHMGGIEAVVDGLATELAGRGHEVVHIASAAGHSDAAASGAYRLVTVPALNFAETRWGVPYPLFGPALLRTLRQEVTVADVVHVHGFLYLGSLLALRQARRAARRPVTILTEHSGHAPYESRILDRTEAAAIATVGRWCTRAADAVVVYNTRIEATISAVAPNARVEWIENGIDTDVFRGPEPGERERLRHEFGWDERPRVLFVARPVAKKGFDVALDAVREAHGAFVLAVTGLDNSSGEDNVEGLGWLPRERLAAAYRAADALILPSEVEGLPVAVQEALASGLPVVATDDPGYRKALLGYGPRVRLLPRNGKAMADALMNVLTTTTPDDLDDVRRRVSLRASATKHEQLYGDLLQRRGA